MLKEFSLKIYSPDAIYIMYDGTSAYDVYGCDVKDEIELNGAEVLKGPIADTPENADKIEAYIEQYNNEIINNGMNENKKKVARISESQLKAIVAESVKRILSEVYCPAFGSNSSVEKVNLVKENGRIYVGESDLYLVPDSNGEFRVYDDGEYEGKYCGSLKTLESMTEQEAVDYIWDGI